MANINAVASTVGAGVSQVRSGGQVRTAELKEQNGPSRDLNAAALDLLQRALSVVSGATGNDLDVLA
jgi:hypothetical protein